MADEALKCFTSLLETVPAWIADLEHILGTATCRQHDILTAGQPAPSVIESKSSSVKSRWSKKNTQKVDTMLQNTSEASLLRPQIPHMTMSDVLRLRQRKHKTISVYSGGPSGPSKYRPKGLAVIYYDSDVQKRFETVVRAVGGCRNSIRKGKMAAKVDALSRTGSSSSSEGDVSSGEEDGEIRFGRLDYKSTRNTGRRPFARTDDTEVFDKVDGLLEKGQLLCEKAAHQILRSGDCSAELYKARTHFEDAIKLAQQEIPRLETKAARVRSRHRRSEERVLALRVEIAKPAIKTVEVPDLVTMLSMSNHAKLEVDLEADDESDGTDGGERDCIFPVLPPSIGRYRMQTSRLYAS